MKRIIVIVICLPIFFLLLTFSSMAGSIVQTVSKRIDSLYNTNINYPNWSNIIVLSKIVPKSKNGKIIVRLDGGSLSVGPIANSNDQHLGIHVRIIARRSNGEITTVAGTAMGINYNREGVNAPISIGGEYYLKSNTGALEIGIQIANRAGTSGNLHFEDDFGPGIITVTEVVD